jgi:hypothetical protein
VPNPWIDCAGLPPGPSAALAALHLSEPRLEGLERLTEREWSATLDYCDSARCTLALRELARCAMPEAVGKRVDADAAKNRVRLNGIEDLYRWLDRRLGAEGLPFVALKGMTHAALFRIGLEQGRVQYDIDLYLPVLHAQRAQQVLISDGWVALEGMETFPTDHLPALIRRTGWEWRGDFFDPEIPLAVELHFQFWNERLERLAAPGTEEFWSRRTTRPVGGIELGMLHPPDALAYASLHLLKHVLRGSAKPFHVFEIASILDGLAADDGFWAEWCALHPPELRRLETLAFRLATAWFGGRIAPALREEMDRLPAAAQAWFDQFVTSPATREFHPNKDELWLHLSLLGSWKDAWKVARRRLLPGNLPPLADHAYIPESELTFRRRFQHWLRRLQYLGTRVRHHAVSLGPTIISGWRWWLRARYFLK